jgi:hypothetical protein
VPEKSFGQRTWESAVAFLKGIWKGVTVFFKRVWGIFGPKFLGPVLVLLVVVVAFLLVTFGFKGLQIGGIIGKLLGKKGGDTPGGRTVEVANSVAKDRVGPDGKLIQPGVPDPQGQTQAVVVPINEPGIFSDPSTVEFTPPGETKPVVVPLPTGVKNSDVSQVVVVSPSVVAVTVKDNSGISAQTVDDLLKKYAG